MADTAKKYLSYEGLQTLLDKIHATGIKGKVLSDNNFTTALLNKLNATATSEGMSEINTRLAALEKLIDSDKDGAINKFNEIVAFLDGIEDTKTLAPIIADVAANKAKLDGIEAGAQKNTVTSVNGQTGTVNITIPTALKSPSAITVTLNNGSTEGTNKFTYDGSAAKTVNITPASIGAQPSGAYLVAADIADKVDKVSGKGLSTNDYTTAEKNAVATIGDKLNKADLVEITAAEIDSLLAPLA